MKSFIPGDVKQSNNLEEFKLKLKIFQNIHCICPMCSWTSFNDGSILLFFYKLFEGQFSGLRWFLATESTLKKDENALSFMLKAILVLEISTFLSWLFVYVENWLDKKTKVNFNIYDVTG